jgi:hypothetical protein
VTTNHAEGLMVKIQSTEKKITAELKNHSCSKMLCESEASKIYNTQDINLMNIKLLSDYDPSCGLHVYILLIFLGTSHTAAMDMAV